MEIGLYIHIPFCVSKCHYCDFLSFARTDLQEAYCNVLIKEIKNQAKALEKAYTVKSIFIGGGTPTVLPSVLLDKIFHALATHFKINEKAEWTIEANPGTVTQDTIKLINDYPINRISLGLQSTHKRLLKFIGRIHTFEDWENSFWLLKENTTCALSSDIMFALPTQTMQEFKEMLQILAAYPLDHLSLYSLILEEGTKFWDLYNKEQLMLAEDDIDRDMYHYAKKYLKELGYIQYEISNWAKPDKACRHNILYWERGEYIGIGLGAHSFFNNSRYHNENDIEKYLHSGGKLELLKQEAEYISQEMAMQEFMFLGLRMTQGVSAKVFYDTFQRDLFEVYKNQLDRWIKYNILVKNNNNLFLSDYGMDVCNEVFSSFL